ncbi:putative Neural cadherin-like 1, partial [Homarus americanus]
MRDRTGLLDDGIFGGAFKEGGGRLGTLVEAVKEVLRGEEEEEERDENLTVQVVSVYGHHPHALTDSSTSSSNTFSSSTPSSTREGGQLKDVPLPRPSTCVWLSVKEATGRFVDPVKLQGLLNLHTRQDMATIEAEGGVVGGGGAQDTLLQTRPLHPHQRPSLPASLDLGGGVSDPSSAATQASTALPLQVVDTNVTSLSPTPDPRHRLPARPRDLHAHLLPERWPLSQV